jgi:N-acetylglucosamine-6-sulfatase
MKRISVVLGLAVLMAVLLALPAGIGLLTENARVDAQVAERPNFVFVLADDLDERSMQDLPGIRGVMTNNIMSTNGTSTNGTTFENAYVTYSLCCPSRASILRGQYPHNHEIIGNGLPEGGEEKFRNLGGNLGDNSTVATWLNDAGYQTKYIGVYMPNYSFKDGLYVPPGWDEWFALKDGHYNLADPTQAEVNEDRQRTTLGGHSSYVFADKASDFIRRSSVNPAPFKPRHKPCDA